MKKLCSVAGLVIIGLVSTAGCSRQDSDRARIQAREAQEKADRKLQEARDKLRRNLKTADTETREDLDKARDQLRHALSQSEKDAERARDRIREKTENDNSHQ
ncbi:MAG: hypothetical protein JOZ32_05400 [Bryobacterales bacterium]|nr:hypothetical protein [Bryobacterales bacterium]